MKSIIFAFVVALVFLPVASSATEWAGETVVEEGATHVKSPETPVDEIRFELSPLWERGDEDDDVLFGQPSQLLHDAKGNLYVLDGQLSEIQVFSPSGEHLRTIGGEGQGPGEFQGVSDMYLGPDGLLGILRIFPGRVYRLGTDGSPQDFFALPEAAGGGYQLVFVGRANVERIVIAGAIQTMESGKQIQNSYIKAFDADGNELVQYHEESNETQFGGMKFVERKFSNFSFRWALAEDGRVAAALDFDTYQIHVWNGDGTLDRIIERPQYKPLKRTSKTKARLQKLYDGITQWSPGSTFEVSETHVAVSQLWFREDGHLWVMSGRGQWEREDGVFTSIEEYDREGRYVRRIILVGDGDPVEDGIFIEDDRLYRVTHLFSAFMASLGGDAGGEADEYSEPLRIIAHQLDRSALGMK